MDEHGSARSYLGAESVLICIQSCQTTSSEDISDYMKERSVRAPAQAGNGFIDASQAACEWYTRIYQDYAFLSKYTSQEGSLADISRREKKPSC